MAKKRENYLEWDEYFMGVAFLAAQRSKDPSTQVGACIVNKELKIVGVGYNGFPIGCSDDNLPWAKSADDRLNTKYPYVCHAELNAIINKNSSDVKGCVMYVTLFPCNECAKLTIQAGIESVIFLSDKHHDKPEMAAARKLFDMVGISYKRFVPKRKEVKIDFESGNREELERSMLIENTTDAADTSVADVTLPLMTSAYETSCDETFKAKEAYVLNARILAHVQVVGKTDLRGIASALEEDYDIVTRSIEFLKSEGLITDIGNGTVAFSSSDIRTSTPKKSSTVVLSK